VFYTYVLQSKLDGNFYVGYTKDLKLRFEQHKKGKVNSTKERRPLKLIYYEACVNQEDALQRERYLKTYNGPKIHSQKSQIVFNRVKKLEVMLSLFQRLISAHRRPTTRCYG
jgi:putative endonuclease